MKVVDHPRVGLDNLTGAPLHRPRAVAARAITARWSLPGIAHDRDALHAHAPVDEHVVDRQRERARRRAGQVQARPSPGGVGGVDVAAVEQVTQLGVVERGVEVAGEDPHVAAPSAPGSAANALRQSGAAAG